MTQETIKKLHKFEENRSHWVKFRDALLKNQNVAVMDKDTGELEAYINASRPYSEGFASYIMRYVEKQIKEYDELIEML